MTTAADIQTVQQIAERESNLVAIPAGITDLAGSRVLMDSMSLANTGITRIEGRNGEVRIDLDITTSVQALFADGDLGADGLADEWRAACVTASQATLGRDAEYWDTVVVGVWDELVGEIGADKTVNVRKLSPNMARAFAARLMQAADEADKR